jgi:archaemetzincin
MTRPPGNPALTRRSFGLLAAALFMSRAGIARAQPDGKKRVLYIQPFVPHPSEAEIAFVVQAIAAFFSPTVSLLSAVPLPKPAFYPPRQRYRAEKLLSYLNGHIPEAGLRVLGVTASDISTTKGSVFDWGILGLADMPGTSCVISSFRCKRRAAGPEHAMVRLGKTAVHELGHTFGLEHCASSGCLMEDAGGSVLTSDREYDFCPQCRSRLTAEGVLREPRTPPWPKPA